MGSRANIRLAEEGEESLPKVSKKREGSMVMLQSLKIGCVRIYCHVARRSVKMV
jgi:hypothetical protein